MKPCIGIVGGAGPAAGFELGQRVIALCQQRYGCHNDSDFPRILVESYPFSDMLSSHAVGNNCATLRSELRSVIDRLVTAGADVVALSCNTLSCFLDWEAVSGDVKLIDMLSATRDHIAINSQSTVTLCTRTSRERGIHAGAYETAYIDEREQTCVDALINEILAGYCGRAQQLELARLIAACQASRVVLGCTELSLLWGGDAHLGNARVIDPLQLVAETITLNNNKSNLLLQKSQQTTVKTTP